LKCVFKSLCMVGVARGLCFLGCVSCCLCVVGVARGLCGLKSMRGWGGQGVFEVNA